MKRSMLIASASPNAKRKAESQAPSIGSLPASRSRRKAVLLATLGGEVTRAARPLGKARRVPPHRGARGASVIVSFETRRWLELQRADQLGLQQIGERLD